MRICYVIAREGVSGGTGTLSFRILSYLHKQGYHCAYLCCENNEPITFQLIEKVVDEIVLGEDKSYLSQFEIISDKYDAYVFLTYSITEYLAIDLIRRKYPSIVRSFLYVVHYLAFSNAYTDGATLLKNRFRKYFLRFKYRHLLKSLLRNNTIIFMDEASVSETSKSLNIKIKEDLIYCLPIEVNDYPPDYWNNKSRHTPFTLGTMCRLEFPFKGYVLGLLKDFILLSQKFDLHLIIVGNGPDENILEQCLSTLPHNVISRIEYIKEVPYSQLDTFYSKCDLVLGMGTVLLDSANHNVLALPVKPYSNELLVSDLFLNDITYLGMKGESVEFDHMLSSLIELTDSDYFALVRRQYECFEKVYNIKYFINNLIESDMGALRLRRRERAIFDFVSFWR